MWAKRSASRQAAIDGQATVSEYVQSRPCEDEESCRESGRKRILQGHNSSTYRSYTRHDAKMRTVQCSQGVDTPGIDGIELLRTSNTGTRKDGNEWGAVDLCEDMAKRTELRSFWFKARVPLTAFWPRELQDLCGNYNAERRR
jgi:hypothetical protein